MEVYCNNTEKVHYQVNEDNKSESDVSSDVLEIDISESPKHTPELNINNKHVLENIEEEIERQLDEKATKTNLSATNVKNILKHVISNEHVLAMVRHTVDDDSEMEQSVFEPKLTRAKAKELLKTQNVAPIPWVKPKANLGVHILISEELPEETDDDEEYLPPKSVKSKSSSPVAAAPTLDNFTQTNWSEDGEFKEPPTNPANDSETENIALRTRSKLSLSNTPLEVIEETLVPPDITTDMYDLECDDEDWRDFIKQFTRPLEEVLPPTQEDDDEADPEYNVLADEELDAFDLEELRQDKGVKITKKELNTLVAELFEFSEIFTETKQTEKEKDVPENNIQENNIPQNNISENNIPQSNILENNIEVTDMQMTVVEGSEEAAGDVVCELVVDNSVTKIMPYDQLTLFEQQMRQHVQMLAQNFLLTYEHPILHVMAEIFQNMLLSLHELSKYKPKSPFNSFNLPAATEFITEWKNMFESDEPAVKSVKQYVADVVSRSKIARQKGYTDFIPTFPPLLLKKVSESSAFLYPSLLPKIPFRCDYLGKRGSFLPSEDELIAIGLEQFFPFVENHEDYKHKKKTKYGTRVRLADVAHFISKYMMTHKESNKIYIHIKAMNEARCPPNPIKYYFKNKKAPVTIHYVVPLQQMGTVPPCLRQPELLPYQWKEFLHPEAVQVPAKGEQAKVPKEIQAKSVENDTINRNELKQSCNDNTKCEVNSQNLAEKRDTHRLRKRETRKTLEKKKLPGKKKLIPKIEEIYLTPTNNLADYIPENECSKVTGDSFKLEELLIIPKNQSDTEKSTCDEKVDIYNILDTPRKIDTNRPTFSEQIFEHKNITPTLKNFKFNSSIFKKIKSENDDMLPSMPVLLTHARNNAAETNLMTSPEKENQTNVILKVERNEESENAILDNENEEIKKDDEDEINALMVASSTMQHKNRRLPANSTKKTKQMREYNATLAMLCPEDPNAVEEKAKNYAQAFYDKVQERLENDCPMQYQKFMEVLSEHDESVNSVPELYGKIESVLSPKHPDLCEEFLTFLTPEQAKQIGKLVPHFMLSNMSLFLRKLEIYYCNQPAQLRRIYNSLTELAEIPDVTMEKVRSTVLPLLKGNALLIDWFLQMFPHEPLPESLMTDWEQISCDDGDDVDDKEKMFETITLPEVEDPYGGPNCICKCHDIDNEMYASRTRHCIPCGTKFLQGRVYVQTGKGLRLAHVSFNNPASSSHNKRLNVKEITRTKRKSETSPSKVLPSPTKQDEEPRHSNESEEDISTDNTISKKSKSLKQTPVNISPKLRKKQTKSAMKLVKTEYKIKELTNKTKKTETGAATSSKKVSGKNITGITKISKKQDECSAASDFQEKINIPATNDTNINSEEDRKPVEVKMEIPCLKQESIEIEFEIGDWEIKTSPGHSAESMDTCEESSQDTLDAPGSDSDNDSMIEVESGTSDNSDGSNDGPTANNENKHSWTRNEDKIILQTFQELGDTQNVFNDIRHLLPVRTLSEIRQRFHILMNLLQEMASEITE